MECGQNLAVLFVAQKVQSFVYMERVKLKGDCCIPEQNLYELKNGLDPEKHE